jgi:hypothetical protein
MNLTVPGDQSQQTSAATIRDLEKIPDWKDMRVRRTDNGLFWLQERATYSCIRVLNNYEDPRVKIGVRFDFVDQTCFLKKHDIPIMHVFVFIFNALSAPSRIAEPEKSDYLYERGNMDIG